MPICQDAGIVPAQHRLGLGDLWLVAGWSVYSATKFGVRALTEALDGEWYGDGIKVRDLMPSFIDTPLAPWAGRRQQPQCRENDRPAGLELTPVAQVAEAAWDAVHGDKVHTYVGKTAKSYGLRRALDARRAAQEDAARGWRRGIRFAVLAMTDKEINPPARRSTRPSRYRVPKARPRRGW
jgi:NAD(P)-dependent dehydrogenase (short-subunit alcohol dehydrogenase family)